MVGDALRVTQANFLFGALMVFAITCAGRPITAPLRSRVMRITADFSYCIYLVHLPLAELYQHLAPTIPQLAKLPQGLQATLQLTCVLTACYLVAWFARRYIELPLLRRKISA
jgi:peptidoglycan/LPS O-acetylase OafA/YrhL